MTSSHIITIDFIFVFVRYMFFPKQIARPKRVCHSKVLVCKVSHDISLNKCSFFMHDVVWAGVMLRHRIENATVYDIGWALTLGQVFENPTRVARHPKKTKRSKGSTSEEHIKPYFSKPNSSLEEDGEGGNHENWSIHHNVRSTILLTRCWIIFFGVKHIPKHWFGKLFKKYET